MSDSDEEVSERQLKVVIVGETGTGKTSLSTRYCHDEFSRQYYPTAGVDFFLKRTEFPGSRNITLQIWDVGGHALEGNMLDKYVFGADVIFLVYDVTSAPSFENLETWLQTIRRITQANQQEPVISVMGNKCDLEYQRSVRLDWLNKFTHENCLLSYIVSARTGEMVALSFQKTIAKVLGLRLTQAEQEEQQPIVKAEILANANSFEPQPLSCQAIPRSSVCCIQ